MTGHSQSQRLRDASQAAERLDWNAAANLLGDAGQSPDVLGPRAFYLSRAKRYDEAVGVFSKLIRLQPSAPRWRYMMGYQFYSAASKSRAWSAPAAST